MTMPVSPACAPARALHAHANSRPAGHRASAALRPAQHARARSLALPVSPPRLHADDADYEMPELDAGPCLGADVCDAGGVAPPPIPAEPQGTSGRRLLRAAEAERRATTSAAPAPTEVNPPDAADGRSYDPAWGEGPYGETLCDAPPHRSFNYYGTLVRGGSTVSVAANSTWHLSDQSRAFVVNSTIVLSDNATLQLQNSTLVLVGSRLVLRGGSRVLLQYGSGLRLFDSRVVGDDAMWGVPRGATWGGRPWVARGDFRADAGGSLPYFMGARPGVPVGGYAMRVAGFNLEARMAPAAGCRAPCKQPRPPAAARVAQSVTRYPADADARSPVAALAGLV